MSENGIEECKKEDDDKMKQKYCELARWSCAVINPMCAFLGGIVGQEILKACSHKITPLQQLLYFDAYEPSISADNVYSYLNAIVINRAINPINPRNRLVKL